MSADQKLVKLVSRPEQASNEVVRLLTDALERAKAGEISGVAIAGVCPDGSISTAWSFTDGGKWIALGALENMKYRLLEE